MVENYGVKNLAAEYFSAPISESTNDFRTLPVLLRSIADWIEQQGIQDPEFDNLSVGLVFTGQGDQFYQDATLYYLIKPEGHNGTAER